MDEDSPSVDSENEPGIGYHYSMIRQTLTLDHWARKTSRGSVTFS